MDFLKTSPCSCYTTTSTIIIIDSSREYSSLKLSLINFNFCTYPPSTNTLFLTLFVISSRPQTNNLCCGMRFHCPISFMSLTNILPHLSVKREWIRPHSSLDSYVINLLFSLDKHDVAYLRASQTKAFFHLLYYIHHIHVHHAHPHILEHVCPHDHLSPGSTSLSYLAQRIAITSHLKIELHPSHSHSSQPVQHMHIYPSILSIYKADIPLNPYSPSDVLAHPEHGGLGVRGTYWYVCKTYQI